MRQRKERLSELYCIFYYEDLDIVDKLEEVVEQTGLKKREIVIRSLKEYLFNENSDK